MLLNPGSAGAAFAPTYPADEPGAGRPRDGPHLLEATLFWPASGVSGVHRVISAKATGLVARGWRHTVLAPGATAAGQIDCGGVPLPGGGHYVWRRSRSAGLIARARPDIVESADPYVLGHAAADAAERLAIPAVAFCHSNLPALAAMVAGRTGPLARWAYSQASRRLAHLYSRYDHVLAPSRVMTRWLQAWGVGHALHQPLGVDCTVFAPQARDCAWRHRLEQRLGITRGTQLVLYTGRFAPEKNLLVAAEAVRRLGSGHALLAVGTGLSPPRGRGVYLLPPERSPRRLARLIASCDVFVHPGDQETFGLAALEAMACGTPVVAHGDAGLGELVSGVGITVDSLQPARWAEAIAQALAHPEAPAVLLARQRALAHDWPRIIDQIELRYRRAIARFGATGPHGEDPVPSTLPMAMR